MVRIGRCSSCGAYVSEAWGIKDNCKDCGGAIDHIKEDIGPVEHLPKAFNIGGLILIVIAIALFITGSVGRNDVSSSTGPLLLLSSSIILFICSLVSQMVIVRKAFEKREHIKKNIRRMRSDRSGYSDEDVKGGTLKRERIVARKIIERR